MVTRVLFLFFAQVWTVLSEYPDRELPSYSSGIGLLFAVTGVFALVVGMGGCMLVAFYLDYTRESLRERLEKRDKLVTDWRASVAEARGQLVQLIREEAELTELKHEVLTRLKNDQQLYGRQINRKVREAEKAKRTVDFVAAQNNLDDGAATVAINARLQAEREAMAKSIRKKLKRAETTRNEIGERARQEAKTEAVAMPKRVDGMTSFFRRRPTNEDHVVIDE